MTTKDDNESTQVSTVQYIAMNKERFDRAHLSTFVTVRNDNESTQVSTVQCITMNKESPSTRSLQPVMELVYLRHGEMSN